MVFSKNLLNKLFTITISGRNRIRLPGETFDQHIETMLNLLVGAEFLWEKAVKKISSLEKVSFMLSLNNKQWISHHSLSTCYW